jgi:bacterioferritin
LPVALAAPAGGVVEVEGALLDVWAAPTRGTAHRAAAVAMAIGRFGILASPVSMAPPNSTATDLRLNSSRAKSIPRELAGTGPPPGHWHDWGRFRVSQGDPAMADDAAAPFLSDVKTLRARARKHLETGPLGSNYGGDPNKTVDILQAVLATELVCVLRYTQHSLMAQGIHSEGPKKEFAAHAKEEQEHMMAVAQRITQLGGEPNFSPEGLLARSASEYAVGGNLVDMIKENLIAERIAVDHYRELIRYFGDRDPSTRRMLEWILTVEEEHAEDMHDLLVAHQGKPMLER